METTPHVDDRGKKNHKNQIREKGGGMEGLKEEQEEGGAQGRTEERLGEEKGEEE